MDQFVNPNKVTNPLIAILRGFGLWKLQSSAGLSYRIYGIFIILFCCLMTFFLIMNLILMSDYSKLSAALWPTLSGLCGCIKFIHVYAYNSELERLLERIKSVHLKTDKERLLVERHLTFLHRFGIFFFISVLGSVNMHNLRAAMYDKPELPHEAWCPFWDWQNSRRDYWLAWTYQCVSVNTSIIIIAAIDTFLCFMLYMIGVEVVIVGDRLAVIGKTMEGNKPDANKILIECAKMHLSTLKLKERIQNFMNFPYFCQISASGIVLSAIVADLTMVWSNF